VSNRAWLLKPEPLKVAKTCIQLVQGEIDVKLPLSHPQFLEMLNDYADMMESEQLIKSVQQLNMLAGDQGVAFLKKVAGDNVIQHPSHNITKSSPITSVNNVTTQPSKDESQTINYMGKTYKRWQGNKEFAGLYRGQARYH
jgi:hypothetical protein